MAESLYVLDPAQLQRIEALHRGFLYQHLYAVGCLLLARSAGVERVVVEGDEDVELTMACRRVYSQVKTRQESLTFGDVELALARFGTLRKAHSDGHRSGTPTFVVVSNAEPGPDLAKRIEASDWPADVAIRYPGSAGLDEASLPPAWVDLPSAVAWLSERAEELPFAMLNPETLVWKLAGRVQLACSGTSPYKGHAFEVTDLPDLFEQVVVSLQDFPMPPVGYRPQQDEPPLTGDSRVRVVSGFSGAGKTVWASQAALHASSPVAYFDVGDMSGPVVAMSLARELAVRLYGQKKGPLGEILLPGASGMELLQSLDRRLEAEGVDVLVVLDNTHKAKPEELALLLQGTSRIAFVLLCQPGAVSEYLDKVVGVPAETLKGWDVDTIAAEAASFGCTANFAASHQLHELTGGLPLYVQGALRVASSDYGGDVAKLCAEIGSLNHLTSTTQEVVLEKMFKGLPGDVREILSLLSIADSSVTRDEATALLTAGSGNAAKFLPKAVRLLSSVGAVQVFGDGRLKVHDAVRILGKARLNELGEEVMVAARKALKDALSKSLVDDHDPTRLAQFVKLLSETGEIDTLVDLAGHEFFHEVGLTPEFRGTLERAAYDHSLSTEKRFAALDALAFAELSDEELGNTRRHLDTMRELIAEGELSDREKLDLASKQMLLAAKLGDEGGVFASLEEATMLAPSEPAFLRVVKYNAAVALHMIGHHRPAHKLADGLVREYYDHLGLHPIRDVFRKQPEEIYKRLKGADGLHDDLKHLADSLDLNARLANALGEKAGLARIHAMKFYSMSGAYDSALKVGQDVVDELIGLGDYKGARDIIEGSLLPSVYRAKIANRVVPIRSQYAVVLAYCGEFAMAEAEMERLAPYESALSETGQAELQNQRILVEEIKRVGPPTVRSRLEYRERAVKIGPNDPCPCGSGKKFKKCCRSEAV